MHFIQELENLPEEKKKKTIPKHARVRRIETAADLVAQVVRVRRIGLFIHDACRITRFFTHKVIFFCNRHLQNRSRPVLKRIMSESKQIVLQGYQSNKITIGESKSGKAIVADSGTKTWWFSKDPTKDVDRPIDGWPLECVSKNGEVVFDGAANTFADLAKWAGANAGAEVLLSVRFDNTDYVFCRHTIV